MASKGPVSIREIARAAGVSAMTVSRALKNDLFHVSEVEALRIRKLAGQMGYSVNPYLSTWMRDVRLRRPAHRAEVIALIYRNREDADYAQTTLEGGNRFAATIGYRVDNFVLADYPNPGALLRVLRNRGIRGVILSLQGGALLPPEILQHSVVWGHAPPEGEPGDFVDLDYFDGMMLALKKLTEYGYRRIAYWPVFLINPHRRWEAAYLYHQSGIPAQDRLPMLKDYRSRSRAEWIRWIKKHRPDVIICPDFAPSWAPGTAGTPEPLDIPWVGLGVKPGSNIAGIDQHLDALGVAAVRMVSRKMELNEIGRPEQPRSTIVQPTWHDEATAPRKVARA